MCRAKRNFGGDLFVHEAHVVEDRREQIVEVVGNTTGKLTEALETLRLMELALHAVALELRLHAITLVLRLDALGHIANGRADEQAFLGLDGGQRYLGRKLRPVGSHVREAGSMLRYFACADRGNPGSGLGEWILLAAPGTSSSTGLPMS